ncbi:OmpA family protein [Roseomonas sp. OT10]|uniref:OmpA family protein n=1 Tax=Roseomonas cutis TaxID=2897332 RepID=UPI001E34F59E|nr:OmpA family protein [Roseomonas sp. OT10]UFN47567.1 OmpA family protein [Roseomonas sp. OT10]
MARNLILAAGAALLLASPLATPAQAQSDPASRSLIDRLRPQAGQTRGIRLPGSEAAPPPAPSPAQPAASAAPAPARPAAPSRPAVAAPPPPPATTAPAGVAAVSITVRFATGSSTLTPAAERELAPLGRALSSAELAPYRFRIEGHTDTVGTAEENQLLSERRAAAVREYLVRQFRVAPDRLEAVGLGESQLLVPTGDQVPEARNRRVQVLNISG